MPFDRWQGGHRMRWIMTVNVALQPAEGSALNLPTVDATLTFTERTGEKPYAYAYDPPAGVPRTNLVTQERTVPIANVRSIAHDLSLDVEGVAVVSHRTAVRDFWDEAQTLALGHPEIAQLVKDVTGASRVVVFDHTLRRRAAGVDDRTADLPRQPANRRTSTRRWLPGRSGCAT
jgi:hypothetical protein